MSIKERIAKLISVKSLVTLTLTGAFTFLAVRNVISGEQFLTIFTVIISFYFGTNVQSHKDREADK